jgi:hypothetical protein
MRDGEGGFGVSAVGRIAVSDPVPLLFLIADQKLACGHRGVTPSKGEGQRKE